MNTDDNAVQARPSGKKPISLITSGLTGVVIGAGLMFWFTYDPATDYRIGTWFAYLEKSASQNSPVARCKQRQSSLEAIISGTDLSRVSGEIFRLQTRADVTATRFTKEGTIRVPYAKDVNACDSAHADSALSFPLAGQKENSPSYKPRSHLCSSLLDEQIRDIQEKKREYSELEQVKAQKSAELDQLQQNASAPRNSFAPQRFPNGFFQKRCSATFSATRREARAGTETQDIETFGNVTEGLLGDSFLGLHLLRPEKLAEVIAAWTTRPRPFSS